MAPSAAEYSNNSALRFLRIELTYFSDMLDILTSYKISKASSTISICLESEEFNTSLVRVISLFEATSSSPPITKLKICLVN